MRVYEGTVEELKAAGLFGAAVPVTIKDETASGQTNGLSPEIHALINSRTSGAAREIVESFVNELGRWGDVRVSRGTSVKRKDGGPYLMFHRLGTSYGAFGYFRPGNMKAWFRLPGRAIKGFKHGQKRNVNDANQYQVAIYMNSPEAAKEAVRLAEKAYRRVAK